MSYTHSCFIPFHLTDSAGILFFGHVFSLAHQAYEQFILQQVGCSWETWFQNSTWIVPIKQADAQYMRPLLAGQECQIDLSLTTLSNSAFTLLTSFVQQQALACQVKTVHVFCDRLTKQKVAIPSELAHQLKHFLSAN